MYAEVVNKERSQRMRVCTRT